MRKLIKDKYAAKVKLNNLHVVFASAEKRYWKND